MNQTDTRQRLVRATEGLLRTQGYSGTGLKQLTAQAGAPWGSLYHFFPGGKADLASEAARFAGAHYGEGWRRAFANAGSAGEAVEGVLLAEIKILSGSDYRNGCPIASMTLDTASVDENLRLACAGAFETWLTVMAEGLESFGAPPGEARDLSLFALSVIEGAITLARAAKDPAALLASARYVREVIDRESQTWR